MAGTLAGPNAIDSDIPWTTIIVRSHATYIAPPFPQDPDTLAPNRVPLSKPYRHGKWRLRSKNNTYITTLGDFTPPINGQVRESKGKERRKGKVRSPSHGKWRLPSNYITILGDFIAAPSITINSQSSLIAPPTASFFIVPTVTSTISIYLNTNVPQSNTVSAVGGVIFVRTKLYRHPEWRLRSKNNTYITILGDFTPGLQRSRLTAGVLSLLHKRHHSSLYQL
ncbi:hypothetical protein V8E54_009894 [Elaphomyces granulatus]